tara:strand:- start:3643 stop:4275 length:633 start_codon:yes stop_codon:yes gene_type:complete
MAEQTYLITANGVWPERDIWQQLAMDANHIVACDGAAQQCLRNQVEMQTVIGDMDSLSSDAQHQIHRNSKIQVVRQESQNENDLVKAIRWSVENGASSIEIIGIEGGDFSHQFAAILALCEVPANTRLHTTQCTIELLPKEGYSNCSIEIGGSFSLFAIGEVEGIQVSGARWNLKDETLTAGTQGLHNQTKEECLEIKYNSGQLLLFLDR